MSAARDVFIITNTLRAARGSNQSLRAAAAEIGVNHISLSSWEGSDQSPTLDNACKWARAHGYRLVLERVE